jgi:putative addiction module component (TIGR02574 family)
MTTLEHIRQEIKMLPPAEQFSLWRDLGHDLKAISPEEDTGIEAAWDIEIETRVHDIKSGKVALVPGEEFEQRTRNLFAELGIERTPRTIRSA